MNSDEETIKFFLTITKEILFTSHNNNSCLLQKELIENLIKSGLTNICRDLLERYLIILMYIVFSSLKSNYFPHSKNLTTDAFLVVVLSYSCSDVWKNWLKDNLDIFQSIIQTFTYHNNNSNINQHELLSDDNRAKIVRFIYSYKY